MSERLLILNFLLLKGVESVSHHTLAQGVGTVRCSRMKTVEIVIKL